MEQKRHTRNSSFLHTKVKKNKITVDRYKIREEQVKKANYKEDYFAQKNQIKPCENLYK